MKKPVLLISSLSLVALLAACSTTQPTDPNWRPDMTTANFGKYPTNYPEVIQSWGQKNFTNPETINYLTMSAPREEYLMVDSDKQEVTYGYSVCVDVSGVKSTSYYKPIQKHWFFIRDNKVIEHRNLDYSYNRVIYRDHKINCDDGE